MRLDAYYYGFVPTGVELVDRVLSAVACAGKAFHNTEDWNDQVSGVYETFLRGETPIAWIEAAAADAAAALRERDAEIARLRGHLHNAASCLEARSDRAARLEWAGAFRDALLEGK